MAKIDGRTLRKDIVNYLKENHGVVPYFTVRSLKKKVGFLKEAKVLEVRFDELDPNLLVWDDVADWILEEWWPANKGKATMSIKVWQGLYLEPISREVKIDKVEVGYGFTH